MKLLLAMLACVAACLEEAPDRGPTITSQVVALDYPQFVHNTLDVLIVVDSGPAMASRRSALRAAYHQVATSLARYHHKVHIGVVTSDLGGPGCGAGDDAAFRTIPAVHGEFIDTGPARDDSQTNYTGRLGDVLADLADAGSDGCSTAQPLAAMARAIAHPPSGFLRGQYFEVIFVSMSDDASPELGDGLATYERALRGVAGDWDDALRMEVIAGPSTLLDAPDAPDGVAFAASGRCERTSSTRLQAFASRFPRATFSSICDGDLSNTELSSGQWDKLPLVLPCIEAVLVDVAPATPGLQHACNVSDVQTETDGDEAEHVVPTCDPLQTRLPCFRFRPNWMCGRNHLEFVLERLVDPPPGTHTRGQCLAE